MLQPMCSMALPCNCFRLQICNLDLSIVQPYLMPEAKRAL